MTDDTDLLHDDKNPLSAFEVPKHNWNKINERSTSDQRAKTHDGDERGHDEFIFNQFNSISCSFRQKKRKKQKRIETE